MAHISITRLRLRSFLSLPRFLADAERIVAQARASPGFLGGALLPEGRMVFWTRTAWDSIEAMKAFRDTAAHRDSMPRLLDWCDEASVAQWQGEMETDWARIRERLIAEGRLTRVRRPSKAQRDGRLADRLKLWAPERPIAPA